MIWHRHSWTEIERMYARPCKIKMSEAAIDEDLLRQMLFGVTTIIYRCSVCGAIKKLEVLGKAEGLASTLKSV